MILFWPDAIVRKHTIRCTKMYNLLYEFGRIHGRINTGIAVENDLLQVSCVRMIHIYWNFTAIRGKFGILVGVLRLWRVAPPPASTVQYCRRTGRKAEMDF